MDLYANHLDTVETHLLQEIAARSSHFFEAAGIVADLRGTLTRTYQQVAGLREQVGTGSTMLVERPGCMVHRTLQRANGYCAV